MVKIWRVGLAGSLWRALDGTGTGVIETPHILKIFPAFRVSMSLLDSLSSAPKMRQQTGQYECGQSRV